VNDAPMGGFGGSRRGVDQQRAHEDYSARAHDATDGCGSPLLFRDSGRIQATDSMSSSKDPQRSIGFFAVVKMNS